MNKIECTLQLSVQNILQFFLWSDFLTTGNCNSLQVIKKCNDTHNKKYFGH